MNTGVRDFFRGLFEVSTNEVKGYYILFIIVLFSLAVPLIIKTTINTNSIQDADDLAMLDSLVKVLNWKVEVVQGDFLIDPNETSYDSMVAGGFRKDIARRIINYREKGGQFRYREDLKKIYGLDEKMYKDLEPQLALPKKSVDKIKTQKSYLNINLVKVVDVINLTGLEGALSGRVIRYRDILGGYVSKNQFDEVYGLTEDQVNRLKSHFYISRSFVPHKVNINMGSWKDLSRHPYISNDLANAIVRYREINGSLKGIEELSAFSLVDKAQRNKLFPYLEF